MSGEAFVLQAGEGRSIDLGAFLVTVKADAEKAPSRWPRLCWSSRWWSCSSRLPS